MWIYKNQSIQSIEELPNPEALFGFVYCIKNTVTGRYYIGKKNFYTNRKKNLTKKELKLITDKRLKTYKKVRKESDWKNYWGSNTELKNDIKESPTLFKREIIALAYSAKQLTYLEMEHQILHDVLRSDDCYNDNIGAKFFRKDLIIK